MPPVDPDVHVDEAASQSSSRSVPATNTVAPGSTVPSVPTPVLACANPSRKASPPWGVIRPSSRGTDTLLVSARLNANPLPLPLAKVGVERIPLLTGPPHRARAA
ncbi:MAG: hypothetical protein JWO22_2588 [Frankiales bacterium]|nr:hypothetical protein [Frankiales bacterium]